MSDTNIKLSEEDFFNICKILCEPKFHNGLRRGQRMLANLRELNPEVSNHIWDGVCNPYYDDKRIGAFLTEIAQFVK